MNDITTLCKAIDQENPDWEALAPLLDILEEQNDNRREPLIKLIHEASYAQRVGNSQEGTNYHFRREFQKLFAIEIDGGLMETLKALKNYKQQQQGIEEYPPAKKKKKSKTYWHPGQYPFED